MKLNRKLLDWYHTHRRELPWRESKDPYKIWISEVILQQTRVEQGKSYYLKFVERFPTVEVLAQATEDEVLLYWKGLGYYSRALNLHQAARQIVHDFNGIFPATYDSLLKLKGVGKYTAAAIASICFKEQKAAVDGNFYRVFSRVYADDYDISSSSAFKYFSELTKDIVDPKERGAFNQAVMDLGATICTPSNPDCEHCPLQDVCLAYQTGKVSQFPVKSKKVKIENLSLHYYFIVFGDEFLVKKRDYRHIWKGLYEFPQITPEKWEKQVSKEICVRHKLTHRNLIINFTRIQMESRIEFHDFADKNGFQHITVGESRRLSFPKPLEKIIECWATIVG